MPSRLAMPLEQKFGSVVLPDTVGPADIRLVSLPDEGWLELSLPSKDLAKLGAAAEPVDVSIA